MSTSRPPPLSACLPAPSKHHSHLQMPAHHWERRLTGRGLGRVEGHSVLRSKAHQLTLWLSLQSPASPPPLRDLLNSLEYSLLSRWFLHTGCDICQTCLLPSKITHLPQLYPTPPRAVYCWLREWGGREKTVKEKSEHAPRPREILPYSHERWPSSPRSFRVLGEIVPASESFFSTSACFENQSPADLIYTPYPPSLSHRPAPTFCVSLSWTILSQCRWSTEMKIWTPEFSLCGLRYWRRNSQGQDSVSGLSVLIMLGCLSSGLWTLCLAPVGTTMEGEDPLRTGESWR